MMKYIENYLKNKKKEIEKISNNENDLLIINAGFMNSGKSSLFNNILGREAFEVKDIRCTRNSKKEKFKDNIYLVDTPGLEADESDDNEAVEAYKQADLIIFVHSVSTGGLRRKELYKIEQIEKLFPSEDYFWKRFYLVLSYADQCDKEEDRQKIKDDINLSIDKKFGKKEIPIFFVSNIYFSHALQASGENRKIFIKESGIYNLIDSLEKDVNDLQKYKKILNLQRIQSKLSEAKRWLDNERKKCENLLKTHQLHLNLRKTNLEEIINSCFDSITYSRNILKQKQQELEELKNELNRL